jgi:hypothetical protein
LKRVLITFVAVLITALWAGTALADGFHPSRTRLLFHSKQELKEGGALLLHFLPSGNLSAGVLPRAYFSYQHKLGAEWFKLEPTLGYYFPDEEPIFSVRFAPEVGRFWSWTDLEYQRPSGSGYWFSQVEMKARDWFHTGFEGDGWGVVGDGDSWSHGAGPNILLRFGKMGGDFALHARYLEGQTAPELFLRIHVFL